MPNLEPIKVYVTHDGNANFRIHLREPTKPYKEVLVPRNSGYLLLSAQANVDALQDSLEAIYFKAGDNVLAWKEVNTDEDKDDNWQRNDPNEGDSNVW
jgi:hypothetical protein